MVFIYANKFFLLKLPKVESKPSAAIILSIVGSFNLIPFFSQILSQILLLDSFLFDLVLFLTRNFFNLLFYYVRGSVTEWKFN